MRKFLKFLLPSCFDEPNKHQSRNSKPRITSQASPDIRRLSCYDIDTPEDLSSSVIGSNVYMFKLDELKIATKGFSTSNMIGQGGFGPVYKGFVDERIRPGIKPQAVAVKILDLEGMQGHKEWLAEVIYLGQLSHPNLVKLVGYCYEKEHRVLVYEFMENGSMENHLYNSIIGPLPWLVRVKIALGAAKGLAFLHEQDKPVIYRDFKASNILLDKDYNAKLSDLGLAKDGPEGDFSHVSTQVMGTEGYCAPEYVMTGHLTTRSDVYSFGVVLLELLTGRRSVDKHRPTREQSLVSWAKPYLRNPEKLSRIMDTRLDGQYSTLGAQKAADIAYRCLSSNQKLRPLMREVVQSLELILNYKDIPIGPFVFTVVQDDGNKTEEEVEKRNGNSHHDVRHKLRFPDSTISGMGMEREKMRYNKGRAR